MTFVSLAVAFCAVLAYMGFRGRVDTVGIDLGTTFSVVGYYHYGKVHIVENTDSQKNIFPSIVHYGENGVIHVGYEAVQYLSKDPKNTIFNAKRYIGRSLDDPVVAEYAKSHPYDTVSLRPEDLRDVHSIVPLSANISQYSGIGFRIHASGHPSVVSPEQVGAEILKHLLDLTAKQLGHRQVRKSNMAVPAKFAPEQRQATGAAFKTAGLKVIRTLEEPTAAAIAYDLHKRKDIHHILVYDFGGGTLDVSILYVAKGSVQVYATDGDDGLGGSDFDMCLYDYMKQRVHTALGDRRKLPSAASVMSSPTPQYMLCNPATIREAAEDVKKTLSSEKKVDFSCIEGSQEDAVFVRFEITIDDFHNSCDHLFQRGLVPITRLLDELRMDKKEIDEIVLVGGTTRIPRIKQQLREYFGKDLNDRIDPDITVAYGAAFITS